MAGYKGLSMSNNAVEAYESGEKPFSKWTKSEILSELSHENIDTKEIKRLPVAILKRVALKVSSWHHTGEYYNKTEFYSVDIDTCSELTANDIDGYIANSKSQKQEKVIVKIETRKAIYLEWSGSRKHPHATEVTATGSVNGNWFILSDGSKHSINARGFRFID